VKYSYDLQILVFYGSTKLLQVIKIETGLVPEEVQLWCARCVYLGRHIASRQVNLKTLYFSVLKLNI
jgi:hypothetical protein